MSQALDGNRLKLDVLSAIDYVRPRPPAALIAGEHDHHSRVPQDRPPYLDAFYNVDLNVVGVNLGHSMLQARAYAAC